MAFFDTNIANDLVAEWLDNSYPDVVFRKCPLLAICTHVEATGQSIALPVSDGNTVSDGTTMEDAVAGESSTQRDKFVVTPFLRYQTSKVPMAQAAYAHNKEAAAVDLITDELEKTLRMASQKAEIAFWGSGFGDIATIASHTNPSGNIFVLTLTQPQDAYAVQANMVLVSKATFAAGTLDASTALVTAVDAIAGTVTVDGGGTWTPNDTHVLGYSKIMQASTSPITFLGLRSWNPGPNDRASLSTPFQGVVRSKNANALAGVALNLPGVPVKSALNQLLQAMSNVEGIDIDTCFLSPVQYGALLDDLNSNRVAYSTTSVTAEMGVNLAGVQIQTNFGPLNVISATFCPVGRIQVLDSSVLKCASPDKKLIQNIAEQDAGKRFIMLEGSDNARIPMRTSGMFYVSNPAALGCAYV